MTLNEFIAKSGLNLQAFKFAYEREALEDPTFHPNRSEVDWWKEVYSYFAYTELEEQFKRE